MAAEYWGSTVTGIHMLISLFAVARALLEKAVEKGLSHAATCHCYGLSRLPYFLRYTTDPTVNQRKIFTVEVAGLGIRWCDIYMRLRSQFPGILETRLETP